MDDLGNDLFQSEFASIDHSPTLDRIKPLTCDRWLVLSAMQKAIRRGDSLTARKTATNASLLASIFPFLRILPPHACARLGNHR
jgi:hypothetical protein